MSPTSSTTRTMRQSCDRCHRQKLRCTRDGKSNTGACDRCLRQRTQCVYSSSLPKGRPSICHSADERAACAEQQVFTSPPAAPATPAPLPNPRHPDSTGPAKATGIATPSPDAPASIAAADVNTQAATATSLCTHEDAIHEHDPDASMHYASVLESPGTPIEDPPSCTWQWPQHLVGGDQVFVDWSRHDSMSSTFPWEETIDNLSAAPPSVLPYHGGTRAYPRPTETTATNNPLHLHAAGHGSIDGGGAEIPAGKNQSTVGGGSIPYPSTMDNNDPDMVIAQLSRLSVRLASLRRSGQALFGPALSSHVSIDTRGQYALHGKLLGDDAFKSVASWLMGGRNKPMSEPVTRDGILHDVFSASHHLLEILRYPPLPAATSSSPSSLLSGSRRRSNNGIIRHLVIACYTSLLSTYSVILIALGHDVRRTNARVDEPASALEQIRLVSVVQLCSYIIRHQHQAVDTYLTRFPPPEKPPLTPPYQAHGHGWPCQDTNHYSIPPRPWHRTAAVPDGHCTCTDVEEVKWELGEVQQRLGQLQQALHI